MDEEGGAIVGLAGGRAIEICLKASEDKMASKSNGTLESAPIARAWSAVNRIHERTVQLQRPALVVDEASLDE